MFSDLNIQFNFGGIFFSLCQRQQLDSNPRLWDYKASVLPLCYHSWPSLDVLALSLLRLIEPLFLDKAIIFKIAALDVNEYGLLFTKILTINLR